MSGEFITLEGIEGVGKTTAVETVATIMRRLGRRVVVTREPGGTPLGENLRALLLAPASSPMAPTAELLLMFAARAQHLADVIEPALHAGSCVVCDRFTDATFAYQGGGRGLDDAIIEQAAAIVHPDRQPHLTLLLDAPVALALARARARATADRFEREQFEFFERVRTSYRARAERYPERFRIIDAAAELAAVGDEIKQVLTERFA